MELLRAERVFGRCDVKTAQVFFCMQGRNGKHAQYIASSCNAENAMHERVLKYLLMRMRGTPTRVGAECRNVRCCTMGERATVTTPAPQNTTLDARDGDHQSPKSTWVQVGC
jgi:hypothetical protein